MNHYPITIVQDFYEDPMSIRQFALKQEFKHCFEIENYPFVFPGTRTKDLSELDSQSFAKICEKLTSIFHNFEYDRMRWQITSSFQSVTEEYGHGIIHQDSNTVLAGVLFLTPNAPLNSGTSIFKEGQTFNREKYLEVLKENDRRFKANEPILSDYKSMFDEIITVNNLFNSLIIYEAHHHHAANHFFGRTLEDSRLTQVFFIGRVDAEKETAFPLLRSKKIISNQF